jgi:hypothetical protein
VLVNYEISCSEISDYIKTKQALLKAAQRSGKI